VSRDRGGELVHQWVEDRNWMEEVIVVGPAESLQPAMIERIVVKSAD
jgi:hypothetical protein